jgi:hypothetical protein
MAPSNEKQQAHDLIERLAPSQISAVLHLLEVMTDPVARSLANAPPGRLSQSLRKKFVRSPLPAPFSSVARAFLTKRFWPSSASLSKILSAWVALRSIPTRRIAKHGQEHYLERPSQGSTPRHRSAHCSPHPPCAGPLSGHFLPISAFASATTACPVTVGALYYLRWRQRFWRNEIDPNFFFVVTSALASSVS